MFFFYISMCSINQKINPQNSNTRPLYKLVQKIYKDGLPHIIRSLFSRIIFFVESKALSKHEIYKNFDVKSHINNELNVIEVLPEISPSGFIYRYNQESINSIKDLDLDLMLRFG